MKYFLDTEFHEDGRIIDLISIGIVAEDGREFYAVSSEFSPAECNDWVKEHVLPKLPKQEGDGLRFWKARHEIRDEILAFVGADVPEFWAYYADYDWVVLCQLFGKMIDLPAGWPMYCRDLKQLLDFSGVPKASLPPQKDEHHALADARWVRGAYWAASAYGGLSLGEENEQLWDLMASIVDIKDGSPEQLRAIENARIAWATLRASP